MVKRHISKSTWHSHALTDGFVVAYIEHSAADSWDVVYRNTRLMPRSGASLRIQCHSLRAALGRINQMRGRRELFPRSPKSGSIDTLVTTGGTKTQ